MIGTIGAAKMVVAFYDSHTINFVVGQNFLPLDLGRSADKWRRNYLIGFGKASRVLRNELNQMRREKMKDAGASLSIKLREAI